MLPNQRKQLNVIREYSVKPISLASLRSSRQWSMLNAGGWKKHQEKRSLVCKKKEWKRTG
ncbi:MAG: hypothetical protein A2029_17490 [Chloroflexi bacterium RBG_19FT_COMBO_47_9]|nr:MAG: hypothetical protein A2029_17490 [Chloroflexi bacterium RBG_19FT_COMBO_47_9]